MINDPIGDMLTRIKNAYMARREFVEIPRSKLRELLAEMLVKLGYGKEVLPTDVTSYFKISLLYKQGIPALSGVKRISKPGLRRYAGAHDLRKLSRGLGVLIVSTPKGLKTHIEAQKEGIGGELLCKVW